MILRLRSLLFYLGLLVITPIFSVIAILLVPLNNVTRSRIASGWAYCTVYWLKLTCNLSVSVQGREHIPDHPSIVLCKHQSAWETIALQTIFPPQIWVMKRELLMIPFLGWAFMALAAIPIDRSAGREALKKLVANGKDRLARGLWVVIFPEGTRTAPGQRAKYHVGGAWLAAHTQSTVVPVAHNAGRYWRKNSFIKYPGTIQVVIGPPIETAGMKPDEVNQRVEAWIEAEMQSL
ncbi:1-acyl-sn-glycerol-3-phosphate acyltransferase [Methylophilaceae bacterium 11]|jgi:1-acyl-sn-glycerol-3-phosphate acyltransferase|uniref:lysophospholipid acyltransferase family protein n=1 Tax=Methylotenera sp. N17 TaxID=1502761 RepID=UPI00044DCC99|nr:lysophospholipid acyltransferase family protein [Methylotenera sp. N17]EUJ11353.1 1-acyl-sn-glycerol-3-phosphate acyltransferase [Methylophilaceae bacterium 11]